MFVCFFWCVRQRNFPVWSEGAYKVIARVKRLAVWKLPLPDKVGEDVALHASASVALQKCSTFRHTLCAYTTLLSHFFSWDTETQFWYIEVNHSSKISARNYPNADISLFLCLQYSWSQLVAYFYALCKATGRNSDKSVVYSHISLQLRLLIQQLIFFIFVWLLAAQACSKTGISCGCYVTSSTCLYITLSSFELTLH